MKKTKNKWSILICPSCGESHFNYTGKLDKDKVEYVICGNTHKRCNVNRRFKNSGFQLWTAGAVLEPPTRNENNKLNNMTHEEKMKYMKIATSIVGYSFPEDGLDMLVSVYELVLEKKGDTDLLSISTIEAEVIERKNIKHRQELLDRVSEKC